jgi:eukaryotic-like serine/threonine-protein kinase
VNPERWQQIKAGLHRALELQGASRQAYIAQISADDADLRQELESLIEAHEGSAESFLNIPAAVIDAGAEDSALRAGARIGNYRLVCEIGQGGMGQVWLAEQVTPVRRLVALKLIRAGMYDETVAHRFQSERQSLAIMDHPAIAKVFDAGSTPQGQPYFVMEYVPGLPITEYCDQKRLKVRERLELFIQACEGVQHAHQKAIIHRDLKPANILIVEVDGKAVPRIIDFGLAKAATPQPADQTLYTQYGQFIGTPGFMSPEQINPEIKDIDTRTDVYSLGVILYVLLAGQQPFETKGQRPPLDRWLRRLREEEPPSLSAKLGEDREVADAIAAARSTERKQLVSLMRGDLEWITAKALERERERRYATPSELGADLRRYLNDEPVVAGPASAVYQIRKFIRRHRGAAAVLAMLGALAIVASTGGLIAVRQKHEAEYQAQRALQAQARLLTQAASQRLKDFDVAGARGIILELLTNPLFARARSPEVIGVFQEMRAADMQAAVLSGHTDHVVSAVYSPDGTRIVTASSDKTARIWDAATGQQLIVLSGHRLGVLSASFSPDGTRILSASFDGSVRVWDARTGVQLLEFSGRGGYLRSVLYSPDATRIVTGADDKTARIWDAQTGAQLGVLTGHGARVESAAFSPDGTRIVTSSGDATARIWNARTFEQLTVLTGHGSHIDFTRFSPDGTRVVTASFDKTVRVWDARTGAQLALLSGHGGYVYSAVFSADGSRVLTASFDKTIRIWDAGSGKQLSQFIVSTDRVTSAAYSPDGSHVTTSSDDNTARIWDVRMGAQLSVLPAPDIVYSAVYSPDGSHIAGASADHTTHIWDARTGTQIGVLAGHEDLISRAAYSPDGSRIVSSSNDKTVRIWDASTDTQIGLFSQMTSIGSVAFSPDGTRIATASADKTARIWDAGGVTQLAVLLGHSSYVETVAYSPDGTRIVTAADDRTARIWDAHSGAQIAVLSGHDDNLHSAEYSPDGARILTAADDKTARVWDARTGEQLMVLPGHSAGLESAAYSPDGAHIVTASDDKTARIWDAHSGAQLAVLAGHTDIVASARYSPDGKRILTASVDKTVRVWDAAVPADLPAQILWSAAAETDPLTKIDRAQLGLPPPLGAKSWPSAASPCDAAAAAFYDPDRVTSGVAAQHVSADIAVPACSAEVAKPGHAARLDYEMGRALFAKGDKKAARAQFEIAVGRRYRAAWVDLADLLMDTSAGGAADLNRAASLYMQAWESGVPIAASKLAALHERGVESPKNSDAPVFRADASTAWRWFQQGAQAGEPNALAHLAAREAQNAAAESNPATRNSQLLKAFRLFAQAAGRAREEDWPDDAWRDWRYKRASLAYILAKQGMMQQVGDAYGEILNR